MNTITRKLYQSIIILINYLPETIVNFGIRSIGVLWDLFDRIHGQYDDFLPPLMIRIRENSNIRANSYKNYGKFFLRYFKSVCKLKKSGRVLDVGCGSGIVAAPLTTYLNHKGKYEGFDINQEIIDWCKNNISPKYPNFNFQIVDVYNGKYNPHGIIDPAKFKFPYKSDYFDIVVLSSVFTHMLPKDLEHYMSEISRVLKRGGKCVISYILIDDTTDRLIKDKLSSVHFKYKFKNYRTINKSDIRGSLEDVVAYDASYLLGIYKKNKLKINMPIYFGYWSGRKIKSLHKQDIIIATKVY